MVTRIFVGRVQEKTTVDTLRKFFNGEATKIDPNAFVSVLWKTFAFRIEMLQVLFIRLLFCIVYTPKDYENFCFVVF